MRLMVMGRVSVVGLCGIWVMMEMELYIVFKSSHVGFSESPKGEKECHGNQAASLR